MEDWMIQEEQLKDEFRAFLIQKLAIADNQPDSMDNVINSSHCICWYVYDEFHYYKYSCFLCVVKEMAKYLFGHNGHQGERP